MFTGLVTHRCEILEREGWRFLLRRPEGREMIVGQSIAHDGACMTVESCDDEQYSFFVMEESLSKTNYWKKQQGDMFNVEFPLQVRQPLDGHLVSWHIDAIWIVDELERAWDGSSKVQVRFAEKFDSLVVPKGSITLNGVSLTVVDVLPWWCSVRLIPQTQEDTNLWALQIGDYINIEFDLLWKYVVKRWRE